MPDKTSVVHGTRWHIPVLILCSLAGSASVSLGGWGLVGISSYNYHIVGVAYPPVVYRLVAGLLFLAFGTAWIAAGWMNWRTRWLNLLRWLSIAEVFFTILMFATTHDLTPGPSPGGFGAGHENLFDIILFYGPVVVHGLVGLFLSFLLIWRHRRHVRLEYNF